VKGFDTPGTYEVANTNTMTSKQTFLFYNLSTLGNKVLVNINLFEVNTLVNIVENNG
jgi:hypothetical protein